MELNSFQNLYGLGGKVTEDYLFTLDLGCAKLVHGYQIGSISMGFDRSQSTQTPDI